jgi:hypothetical protein
MDSIFALQQFVEAGEWQASGQILAGEFREIIIRILING